MSAMCRREVIWAGWLLLASLLTGAPRASAASDEPQAWFVVARAYAEMHTGPGRGYPVFHVVERGEEFTLLRRRTDWLQVETRDGKRGWMHVHTVEASLTAEGGQVRFSRPGYEQWRERRIELGFGAGDFDGDPLFSFRAGYRTGPNFVFEAQLMHAAGSFSSTTVYHGNLQVLPFPEARVSPHFGIGAGRIRNEPRSTLVDAATVEEWAGNAALGARAWLTQRFMLRGDIRHFVLTRDVDNNDEFTELSLGFSVFF
jgi:hypothetical protein